MTRGRAEVGRQRVRMKYGRAELGRASVKMESHLYPCPGRLGTSTIHLYRSIVTDARPDSARPQFIFTCARNNRMLGTGGMG